MKVRHRLVWIAAGIAAAVTVAFGQSVSIQGPQGHSISAAPRASDSTAGSVSYWDYRNGQESQSAPGRRSSLSVRYGSNIRYGGGYGIRRGIDIRRGPFRYRIRDYSRRRFANLKPHSQGARFAVSRSNYDSGVGYTSSFKGPKRFKPSIRYGFR